MDRAYINRIAPAIPDHDIHQKFVAFAPLLIENEQERKVFKRMADRAAINHRYSVLEPHPDPNHLDKENFYKKDGFPGTHTRMRQYERHAFPLAHRALERLGLASMAGEITHLIWTTCTGFYAPGLDIQVQSHYKLKNSLEKTLIGFMGCHAALNALKVARHIVRSQPSSKILLLNLELCTLHLKQIASLEEMISFLVFGDGCAASLISAEPQGLELNSFESALVPATGDLITWRIGDEGFDMNLSGQVPSAIANNLAECLKRMALPEDIRHWAVHPGGRSILDAVRVAIDLPEGKLRPSRQILKNFGNMSSASVMFALEGIMRTARAGETGFALTFGPGLTVETMYFTATGNRYEFKK